MTTTTHITTDMNLAGGQAFSTLVVRVRHEDDHGHRFRARLFLGPGSLPGRLER
ncbi:hypothetical protein [Arthrobacter mobilis]|uniref:Uncharacterized protein n=1 Tax=Arthrobacter mobilis TaxID=2724944 RepID=A0A7X6K7Q3_9MICC|nr:hypothetical protein [Arthrobacter mobilis]NKX56695.1 hypothetical protein [Arthrobacter mobilis]